MSSTITFNGWDEFIKKTQNLPQVIFEELDGVCMDSSEMWAELAKHDAPKDEGYLSQNINSHQEGLMNYEVTSLSEISHIAEWGSGKKVKVPSDLEGYASEFKGKPEGGTAEQALKSITGWVKRKGIRFDSAATYKSGAKKGKNKKLDAETTAHLIFHFIMLHGVRPHPFFFIQKPKVEKQFFEDCKKILNTPH